MTKEITIYCKNTKETKQVPIGSSLLDIYAIFKMNLPYGVTSAKVNNKVEGLHYIAFNNKDIEFLDVTSPSGMRTYTRSLFFVLYKAVVDLYPGSSISIEAPVSNGYYCKINFGSDVRLKDVDDIRLRMQEIIKEGIPFHRNSCYTSEATALFRSQGMDSKVKLLESINTLYTYYYTLDGIADYYYSSLLINTNQIYLFDLVKYYDGVLLRLPNPEKPDELRDMVKQEKMLEVFQEHHRWQDILGVSTIGDFNDACSKGYTYDLINVSEAIQEKKIASIAEDIQRHSDLKVILISGPSSSGKTTFSKRLAIQLMACGLKPIPISLDNYFVDRDKTPLDKDGIYDFENIDALNISLLDTQVKALLNGEKVELPIFNFQTGKSEKSGKTVQVNANNLLIFEGIHALNPILSMGIPDQAKYKIYTSALTSIMLDDHNYIPTTDNRLLRRIVRDYKYRGYSALDTIRRWQSVRSGENKWIFPFQENADAIFNSALLFELAVIRNQARPLLEQVPESEPEYAEASRLLHFLSYLNPISTEGLPPTSLLREFLGGSTFRY
ncbi:MAG: nucleoside kinase [Bacteroidaceae bacterium]